MAPDPDPYGQAALMLSESIMLLLIEGGVLSKENSVAAIDGILDIKQEAAGETESVAVSLKSMSLLMAIRQSLEASVAWHEPSEEAAG